MGAGERDEVLAVEPRERSVGERSGEAGFDLGRDRAGGGPRHAARANVGTVSAGGEHQPLGLERLVGACDGVQVDAEVAGQLAHGGQCGADGELAGGQRTPDPRGNLLGERNGGVEVEGQHGASLYRAMRQSGAGIPKPCTFRVGSP